MYRQQQQLDRVLLRNQDLAAPDRGAGNGGGGGGRSARRDPAPLLGAPGLRLSHDAQSSLRVIPVWVRVLAGVVVAAAALAIILLIRGVPGQVVDGVGFVRLAAQAILYLCVIVLFGYVAATGLPAVPLVAQRRARPCGRPQPELQLTPDLHRFLARLRERHPGIRECWLLDAAGPGEWRLLAIADDAVLDAVRGDWDIRRKDVRLYLLEESPGRWRWPGAGPAPWRSRPGTGSPRRDALAEFRCPVAGEIRLAQRLWSS